MPSNWWPMRGHFRLDAGPKGPAAIPVVVLDNRPEPGSARQSRPPWASL